MDINECKLRLSKARYILTTRCEYIDDVRVLGPYVYITMRMSSSRRINQEIEKFIHSIGSIAAFAIRKDTSTNLLVMGTISSDDITKTHHTNDIESRDGKFYRVDSRVGFRVRIPRNSCFNINVQSSGEFLDKVYSKSFNIGFVCPKMSSGKMPYIRGLISLLGSSGEMLSKDGSFKRRHSGCFFAL